MIQKLGPNKEYIVRRYEPKIITFSDALDIASMYILSFNDVEGWRYVLPRKFEYRTDEDSLYQEEPYDAVKRLNLYMKRQKLYQEVCIVMAYRFLSCIILMDGYVAYGLYTTDKLTGKADRLIGYCSLSYPKYMIQELNQEIKPGTTRGWGWLKWKLYTSWISFQCKCNYIYLRLRYGDHPVFNSRMAIAVANEQVLFRAKYPNDPERLNKLSKLNYDQLREEYYEHDETIYTNNYCIHPKYWGIGLGQMFYHYAIGTVPNVPCPFVSVDKKTTSYGPQKFALRASPMGLHLYKKIGYYIIFDEMVKGIDGIEVTDTFMHYIRE